MKQKMKQALAALGSAAILAQSPLTAFAGEQLGMCDFNDGAGLPWHICESTTGKMDFSIDGGTYNITIVNPGGVSNGGEDRWDCQFRHRNLTLVSGHTYRMTYSVWASNSGWMYAKLGDMTNDDAELWHSNGNMLDMTYKEGASQEEIESALKSAQQNGQFGDYNQWQGVNISGNTWNTFAYEFTLGASGERATNADGTGEWTFHFGGDGQYTPSVCFPAGTELKFDNLALIDMTDDTNDYIHEAQWQRAEVLTNQVGYFPKMGKKATLLSTSKKPVKFDVKDSSQYYLYGLGLGNGYRNRGFYNIVTGDMGLDHRDDYRDFAEYRNRHVDTLVYQGNFRHTVARQFQVGTGVTLPIWDIGVTGDLQWREEFSQAREYPLYLDTTTVWPKIGIGINVPNFSQRISFLNGFRSVSAAHHFDYTRTTTVRPFQSAEDSWSDQLNFNPLIRVTFLTQKNMRIENSVRMKIESTDRRPKEEVIGITSWPDSTGNGLDTSDYFWDTPWIHTSLYNDFAFNIGDDFSISYPLKLKKGFNFFKWYFKFENDIDLKLTAGYDYNKTIRKEYDPDPGYNMWNKESGTDGVFRDFRSTGYNYVAYNPELTLTDRTVPSRTHEWFIRPSAAYMFNRIASMSSYIEYRQIHEKLDDETPHLRQILQFEIALMLRFN